MSATGRRLASLLVGVLLGALLLPGSVEVWVDDEGHTYLIDGEAPPAPGARRVAPRDLALQWQGDVRGEPLEGVRVRSGDEARYLRSVFAARGDVQRGETERALRTLRRLHASQPDRPEAAYLLALIERKRGRLEPAHAALETVLGMARELPAEWRETARALRGELEDELELARRGNGEVWRATTLDTPNFRISYDHAFAGRDYGAMLAELLERVRARLRDSLDRELRGPLEVRIYTRGHYLDAYEHRFGFATVGFYDGAIHAVSARHPREELYALVVHEYVHALFEDALGGHQPFFLNEGIAEREEARARGRERMARGEWRRLLDANRSGEWVPLQSIVAGFTGLEGKRALLAYLESRAAVDLIEERQPGALARWLGRCAAGQPWERALKLETGWDVAGLEAAVRSEARSRFAPDPLR